VCRCHDGRMREQPWWNPGPQDVGWDQPLPDVVILGPDWGADLPLWGDGFGEIAWQYTKFSPGLLDRLSAWQERYEASYPWSSDEIRNELVQEGRSLETLVRHELGQRSEVVLVDPDFATAEQ